MSISFNPDILHYAVVEYLAACRMISDPVDHQPEQEEQYRVVCLSTHSEDAWRITHLLRATHQGLHAYSVVVAEPLAACEHGEKHCESCGTGIYGAD